MAIANAATSNGPPKDVDPTDLVARLTALPRPTSTRLKLRTKNTDFCEYVLWVLTAGELSSARWEAEKATRALMGDAAKIGSLAYEEEFEQQKGYHLFQLAVRQPDPPYFPLFPRIYDVKQNMTDDEISVVLWAYKNFRLESGPIISEMTPEEMEVWFQVLSKGFDRLPLSRCSGEALIDLIQYLVSKLATSQTGTSSAGSPPAAASTPAAAEATGDPVLEITPDPEATIQPE